MLVGIKAGATFVGQAGMNRPEVKVTVSPDGEMATIGSRNIRVTPDVLVFVWDGPAGSFHGVKDPEVLKTVRSYDAPKLEVGKDVKGVLQTSSSGGSSIAALVAKVEKPFAIVTSGYDGRRGWLLHLFSPDGAGGITYEKLVPVDYRAKFAPVDEL